MAEEPKESPAFQQMALNVNKIQQQMDQMRDMFLTAMANRAPVPFPVANAPPAVYSLLVPVPPVQSFISKKFLQRSSLHQEGKSTKRILPPTCATIYFAPKVGSSRTHHSCTFQSYAKPAVKDL